MENKIKTTQINPILGGLSIAINILFNFVGCIQIFGSGITSGDTHGLTEIGETKLMFAIPILIAGILAFINIKAKNKVIQIISSILFFTSAIVPILIRIILDEGHGYNDKSYVAGLIQIGLFFAVIGIAMGIYCLLPVIRKNKKVVE